MRRTRTAWLAVAALVGVAALLELRHGAARAAAPSPSVREPVARVRTQTPPLSFEANLGQTDACVRFLARAPGMTAFVTPTETVFALHSLKPAAGGPDDMTRERTIPSYTTEVVRMRLVGANPSPVVAGGSALPGKSNYFIGDDRSKWVVDVPHFESVVLRDVYPGVDLVWHGDAAGRLTYDLVVAPGVDVARISLALDGARDLTIAADGTLRAATGLRELLQTRPVAFQMIDGARRAVDAAFALTADGRVRFDVGAYDARRPLVVDPTLSYSTFLDGSGAASAFPSIAVDATGAVYVADSTTSTDFPTQSPAQATAAGGIDAVVTKIDPTGATIVYSTYLGGGGNDLLCGIAVDAAGAAYLAGGTSSTNFPVQSAIQGTYGGGQFDGFVAKLSSSGSSLVYSTYLGGSGLDRGWAIAVDGNGAAYVAGNTGSTNFPTASPLQGAYTGVISDAYVAKINAAGSALVYSTYLGGTQQDEAHAIAVDSSGAAYVCGLTNSTNFPTVAPLQSANSTTTNADAFVSKISASGASLVYSTYLGGSGGTDVALAIAIDTSGAAYVTGQTGSGDFPVSSPVQAASGGSADAYVAKIASSGGALVYSTFLGGNQNEIGHGIAVDSNRRAVVVGGTTSTDFPTATPFQATFGGGLSPGDAWVTVVNTAGSAFASSTFLGGSAGDQANWVAIDASDDVYVVGYTASNDFPLQSPLQGAYGGGTYDMFVTKFPLGTGGGGGPPPAPPAAPINLVATYAGGAGVSLSWTDASTSETGFRIERHPAAYSFALLATTGADATSATDKLLNAGTAYTYRVRAFGPSGASEWSNEAAVTTPADVPAPSPPNAPARLVAVPLDDGSIDLSWSDESRDEVGFEIERGDGGASLRHLVSVKTDVTGYPDYDVHPGWPYTYRVRALSLQGPSPWSNTATATATPTIDLVVTSGSLVASSKAKHDAVKIAAKYGPAETSSGAAPDPVAEGLDLQLGASVRVSIAPGDPGWKVKMSKAKKGKPAKRLSATWKSAKGASPKTTVAVDFVRSTITTTLSSFDFAAEPTSQVRFLMACGAAGGGRSDTWTAGKPGSFKFKLPR